MTEPRNLRLQNRSRLTKHVLELGMASRTEISEAIQLSKVTVTSISNDLLTEGWLIESGKTEGVAGRPAGLLELHPKLGTVMAIDVQFDQITSLSADLRFEHQISQTHVMKSISKVTGTVLKSLEHGFETQLHGALRQVVISVPAPIDANGMPTEPTNLTHFDAKKITAWGLEHGVPIRLENDIKLASIAEFKAGAARGSSSFALLAERDSGVGLSLFLGGRLYRGEHGKAGEIALVKVPHGGKLVPLERLPLKNRETALSQLVSSLAVALDLNLILVHQPETSALAFNLVANLKELVPKETRVATSRFGDESSVLGAMFEAQELARTWLLEQVQHETKPSLA
jgi:hypothetical protein